ncbi:STAS domain-containing protein [Rubrobacter aplysinae]|uniref:STAS domain-containing protein n=1 Tax=Rubrobacter aplysinae TaxID=909625 RepID=UPI00069EAE58|nr:STAS domain-containing protein [Rubrobacter aplysinae]
MESGRTSGFTVLVTEYEGVPVVSVAGEIDLYAVPRFRSAMRDACAGVSPQSPVLVDLSDVDFMDSSGLGVLIGYHRELCESGSGLRIVAGEAAMKILRITHLDDVLGVYDSREAALSGRTDGLS